MDLPTLGRPTTATIPLRKALTGARSCGPKASGRSSSTVHTARTDPSADSDTTGDRAARTRSAPAGSRRTARSGRSASVTTATASNTVSPVRDRHRGRVPLGAHRQRVARVLDVHRGEHLARRPGARRPRGSRCTGRRRAPGSRGRPPRASSQVERSLIASVLPDLGRHRARRRPTASRVISTFAIRRPDHLLGA